MGSSFRAISSRIGSTHSAAQLGGGGWGRAGCEGWSCQAMVQPGSAEKQCQHAAAAGRLACCLLSHASAPGSLSLLLYVEWEMMKQSWGGKSTRRHWKYNWCSRPATWKLSSSLESWKANARDQCQRGAQLPMSLCEVWQVFMFLTLRSAITVLFSDVFKK